MEICHDYHLHSDFSADSDTPAEAMVRRAVELGLSGMCFTEHMDPDMISDGLVFTVDFESYFAELRRLREKYAGRIRIRIGMEFGLQPHLPDRLRELAAGYPFDFIIASQHLVEGKDPYYPSFFQGHEERECYEKFFREEYENLKRFSPEDWDTLGHMDYVVRYGPNRNQFYSYKEYSDCIDPILRFLIDHGKCLEVNTGGIKYGLGEPNPAADVLRRYRELGGERITIGSDAHEPAHLGYAFDQAAGLLRKLGFRSYTVFEQRQARQVAL